MIDEDDAVKALIKSAALASGNLKPFVIDGPGYRKLAHPATEVEDGIDWIFIDLPFDEPQAPMLRVSTLTGFADYIVANKDGLTLAECMVTILDPANVFLLSRIIGASPIQLPNRKHYLSAQCTELIKSTP